MVISKHAKRFPYFSSRTQPNLINPRYFFRVSRWLRHRPDWSCSYQLSTNTMIKSHFFIHSGRRINKEKRGWSDHFSLFFVHNRQTAVGAGAGRVIWTHPSRDGSHHPVIVSDERLPHARAQAGSELGRSQSILTPFPNNRALYGSILHGNIEPEIISAPMPILAFSCVFLFPTSLGPILHVSWIMSRVQRPLRYRRFLPPKFPE